jgi:hypothetical protein
MFNNAYRFNSDISGWKVRKLVDLRRMFYDASSFSQDLCAWRTSLPLNPYFEWTFLLTTCANTSDPMSVNLGPFCAVCPSLAPTLSPTPGPGTPSPTSSTTNTTRFTSTQELREAVVAAQSAGADCDAEVYITYGPMQLAHLDWIFSGIRGPFCPPVGLNLNNWNVSQVTSMTCMSQVQLVNTIPVYWPTCLTLSFSAFSDTFYNSGVGFQPIIDGWDTSAVGDMSRMVSYSNTGMGVVSGWLLIFN